MQKLLRVLTTKKSFDLYWNKPDISKIRSERQPCNICDKENFKNFFLTFNIHFGVRFTRFVVLISIIQKLYCSHAKLFEFKPCDFNIQVHFFVFTILQNLILVKKTIVDGLN